MSCTNREVVKGKCLRQRASRNNSYYNREAEDEYCILLVMLPLG